MEQVDGVLGRGRRRGRRLHRESRTVLTVRDARIVGSKRVD